MEGGGSVRRMPFKAVNSIGHSIHSHFYFLAAWPEGGCVYVCLVTGFSFRQTVVQKKNRAMFGSVEI
jgi:hypothetical protein